MSDHDEQDNKPTLEIAGPSKISLVGSDDDGEETTRRIAVAPAFDPTQAAPFSSPSLGFSGPSPTLDTNVRKAQPSAVSMAGKTEKDMGVWRLKEVPELPQYHPLERTAVFVPNAEPSEVAIRISDVLRDRSIEASYDNEKAKVKCVTADGVDFRIRLYRGRGKFSHGIIVEVQRRFGASMNFHNDTMGILNAAEGKVPPPPSLESSNIIMVSDVEDDYQPDGSSSLDMVAKMFQHAGYDSHYLGFQTLIPLTDGDKMGKATAKSVSAELLRPGNEVGTKVLALVMAKRDEEDMFKLRSMAMTVFANAVASVKGNIDASLREEVRPVLIEELFNADKNPRSAQMAAKCVEHLLQGDHVAAEFHDALDKAREVGAARHAGLEKQAKRCLDKIGNY